MKVTLICQSDLMGGAAVVTFRLMHALRDAGVDAWMLVGKKLSSDPHVVEAGGKREKRYTFLKERVRIALSNGFSRKNLFKVSTADSGIDLSVHPLVSGSDIICLNWINQGLLSLKGVKKISSLGKPLVWTMHDMWNMTGICHHAYECTRYRNTCGECPYLNSHRPNDLSNIVWERKKRLYGDCPITFVAVSNWLAGKAAESSLLGGADVRVIPNAFPVEKFSTSLSTEGAEALRRLGVDTSKRLIIMGAARLDDPIKGLPYAIEALNIVAERHPEVAGECQAVFFGDVRNPEVFNSLLFNNVETGRISEPSTVQHLYSAGSIVLSTSLYETLPGTLIEGQAAGCLPVTFGMGGQSDIVTHLSDGYIADYKSSESIAEGIVAMLAKATDRERLHRSVSDRFAATAIAARYISLFEELLKNC